MSDELFNEFYPVSSKQWKQKIQFDLNGADYNKTLIWESNEGIAVKPFYHPDEFKALPQISNNIATEWDICQSIYVADVKKSNLNAIKAIESGAESIKFILPSETISVEDLIKNIDYTDTAIHFELKFLSEAFIKQLPKNNKTFVHTDIIGNLARNGNWYSNLKEDFSKFEGIIKTANSFSIDASLYQNAGANMVQQLAYAMSHANEYLNYIDNHITHKNGQPFKIIFNFAVGSNHFFEIAKLRAFRALWNIFASEYKIASDIHIMAFPTKRNKTLYDSNINLLRTTTECMSAVLGGANTVCNLPYDVLFHKTNEFGERIARNQLLVLKHESYFEKVANPADGSYYIESLTDQLAEKALTLFKDIEANGGFLKHLKKGTIQRKIKESAFIEQKQFDSGEIVLLGTNKHLNQKDEIKQSLELYPFVKTHQRKTIIEPIIEKRLADNLEQKRLKNEN